MTVIQAIWVVEMEGFWFEAGPREKVPYLKNKLEKKGLEVWHFPNAYEALSSNPSITQKKKKGRKKIKKRKLLWNTNTRFLWYL
jgi:hypothetical protein